MIFYPTGKKINIFVIILYFKFEKLIFLINIYLDSFKPMINQLKRLRVIYIQLERSTDCLL
jgi:hypothetical protein